MKAALLMAACLPALVSGETPGPLDRVEEALAWASPGQAVRLRLSGTLDLEQYSFDRPAPAFFATDRDALFNPRLSVFLDGQLGAHWYVFAQQRVDRGFDPGEGSLRGRLDEYAVRLTPRSDGLFSLQVGKFATVAGGWVHRHDSWSNPFLNAPLPYENVTGLFDQAAAPSAAVLRHWADLGPGPFPPEEYLAAVRVPILWGPSYAQGASISGTLHRWDYALELKNAALSSRPETWRDSSWKQPTVSGRVGFRPDLAWNFGVSASSGPYLLPKAGATLAPGYGFGDYRENVLGADASYAWHHVQLWAEVFQARFAIPRVGVAKTWAYYVEGWVKFTPAFSAAVRWNQQGFGRVTTTADGTEPWGRDTWRIDFAPEYRFTPHLQLKVQYSLQHHPLGFRAWERLFGTQLVLRF